MGLEKSPFVIEPFKWAEESTDSYIEVDLSKVLLGTNLYEFLVWSKKNYNSNSVQSDLWPSLLLIS